MLLWAVVGVVLIGVVLLDAFETIVLPRRATRRLRLARLVLRSLWWLWSGPARGPRMSGNSRPGGQQRGPPSTMSWTACRRSQTGGVVVAMSAGVLGAPNTASTLAVAHVPEACTAVCASPEQARAVFR